MQPGNKCPYCDIDHIKFIRGNHKQDDHLKLTLDFTELPLEIISQLKMHFVKRQQFETAVQIRLFEKLAIKQQELANAQIKSE